MLERVNLWRFLSSADCPWWWNIVYIVAFGVFAYWQWGYEPSHTTMLYFTFDVWAAWVNFDYLLEKMVAKCITEPEASCLND